MLKLLASPLQLYPALRVRRFQVLQRTCWLSWRRNQCLPHEFSKQCECFTNKKFLPWKGRGEKDWAVWCCGLIFYLCLCMLGEQSEDNIRLWISVCVKLISRQRILINKGEALTHLSELTPVVLQVRWHCHGIFRLCTKRALKWLRKTCSWPGGAWAQVNGLLLGNLMKKWQNKIGNHLQEAMNTFLAQHPEPGWQKVHPSWSNASCFSLSQQRWELLRRSLERVTDLNSDSARWVCIGNSSPGGILDVRQGVRLSWRDSASCWKGKSLFWFDIGS